MLKDNEPYEGFESEINLKSKLHDIRMAKKDNHDDCTLTEEMFDQAVDRFKRKNKPCYNLLTKAGNMFRQSLLKLFEVIWEKEVVPSAWDLTTLTQIYKEKGPAEKLDNNRRKKERKKSRMAA